MNGTSIESYLFTQGVLGIVLFVVASVFFFYYKSAEKDKKDLAAEVKELNKLVFGQMDLRVEAANTIGINATNALKDNSQALYVISEKIETNKASARMQ